LLYKTFQCEDRAISFLPVPPFYFRYVDDIILAAPSLHFSSILKVLNSVHKRLQFTIEFSDNNTINFLDISLIVNENRLEFDWFRKFIFSERFLNFFSYYSIAHKIGIVM
ncbi:hypothetical protein EAG_00225, partial [Camponotus floridanus]